MAPDSIENCLNSWYFDIKKLLNFSQLTLEETHQGIFLFRYWESSRHLRVFRIWQEMAEWCEIRTTGLNFWPSTIQEIGRVSGITRSLTDGCLRMYLLRADGDESALISSRLMGLDIQHPLLNQALAEFPVRVTQHETNLLTLSYQIVRLIYAKSGWSPVDCAESLLMTSQYVFGTFQRYLSNDLAFSPDFFPKVHGNLSSKPLSKLPCLQLNIAQAIALCDLFLQRVQRGEQPMEVFDKLKYMPVWRDQYELVNAFYETLLASGYLPSS